MTDRVDADGDGEADGDADADADGDDPDAEYVYRLPRGRIHDSRDCPMLSRANVDQDDIRRKRREVLEPFDDECSYCFGNTPAHPLVPDPRDRDEADGTPTAEAGADADADTNAETDTDTDTENP